MQKNRALPAVLFAVAVSALVGGVLGRRAQATSDPLTDRYRVFTAALAAIEQEYVEDVESDRLVYSAINGMLQTLDPHSSFMDPRTYAQMRERQEGRYYGLGITSRRSTATSPSVASSKARRPTRRASAAAT